MIGLEEIIRRSINFGRREIKGRGDNSSCIIIYILLYKYEEYLCGSLCYKRFIL